LILLLILTDINDINIDDILIIIDIIINNNINIDDNVIVNNK